MARSAWSAADARFLKSLGIAATDPPSQDRYLAVEGVQGWWHVIDRDHARKRIKHFGPHLENARTAAIEAATQLNESDVTK
jgi:hypothetical protein